MHLRHLRSAALKASVVLVPSYLAAYLSDKMVWVVPTLAASSFFAATIGLDEEPPTERVDEEAGENAAHEVVDSLSETIEVEG